MVARYWFERLAQLPVEVDIASEYRYRDVPSNRGVSLSSFRSRAKPRTRSLRCATPKKTASTSSRCQCAEFDDRARKRDRHADLAGPEIGVASTKAFTCQLAALAALALAAGRGRGVLDAARERELVRALIEVPRHMSEALALEPQVEGLAHQLFEVARRALSRARHELSAGA